jgi:hypothetical protein
MKLSITDFSLASCYLFRLRPKYNYLLQRSVLRLEAKFRTHTKI